ncbi:MAG: hypothetical protein JW779_13925 [Candidatus Thorarchaeota archaeon]|nr:hypothetical protein [Candidatus Thorarchaeota archaeon]
MTSEIDNESKTAEEANEALIEELKPRMKSVKVVFRVVGKGEVREVSSRNTGEKHRVTEAIVGDSTGIVTLPLWDESIGTIEVGKTYSLENGYTGLFRGNLQLKIGRNSTVTESETEIGTVNQDVDMSAENHRRSRERHWYQPSGTPRGYTSFGNSRRDNERYSHRERYSRHRRRW